MEIVLEKKPKNPIIIEGFPGFGFVSTIATEFLIEHLGAKLIGRVESNQIMPMVAMHNSKIVEPLGIFYDSKSNIMIFHAITNVGGLEWELADKLAQLARELKVKEVISLEGVASNNTDTNAFFYSNSNKSSEIFKKNKVDLLKEGIIMGVTGALLLKANFPMSAIFVETHSQLPDSRAAAKIIEVLDKYLNLKVDYKPLLQKAEEFESKLKNIVQQKSQAEEQKEKKELTYFG